MEDVFTNRLGMFDTSMGVLISDTYKPVWFQQPPVIFTTKVGKASTSTENLRKFCQDQGVTSEGATAQKEKEGGEAELVGLVLASALVEWFYDQGDVTNAKKVEIAPSELHVMRDQAQLQVMNLVVELGNGVVAGPHAAQAVNYGITAGMLQAAKK